MNKKHHGILFDYRRDNLSHNGSSPNQTPLVQSPQDLYTDGITQIERSIELGVDPKNIAVVDLSSKS